MACIAKLMFDIGADDTGGVFRAKREGLRFFTGGAGAVLPCVHLLGDDVGLFANAAGKEFRGFQDRRADLAEAVAGEDGTGGGFDAVPEGGFGGEQITGAAYGFERRRHEGSSLAEQEWKLCPLLSSGTLGARRGRQAEERFFEFASRNRGGLCFKMGKTWLFLRSCKDHMT